MKTTGRVEFSGTSSCCVIMSINHFIIFVIDYLKRGHRGQFPSDYDEEGQAMYLYSTNCMQHLLRCQER